MVVNINIASITVISGGVLQCNTCIYVGDDYGDYVVFSKAYDAVTAIADIMQYGQEEVKECLRHSFGQEEDILYFDGEDIFNCTDSEEYDKLKKLVADN